MKETIYFESKVKKIDGNISDAIKKIGIVYPHPALAFFRSIYAEFEKPNKNKVILAKSVKENVPQLIGCQVNLGHRRYGWIVGQILDASVNKNNEIEIIFTFHKSIYDKEYERVLQDFGDGNLTVSFELRVAKDDIELLQNGNRRLHQVEFEGVGLLLANEKPACPSAKVFESAMKIIEDALHNESSELVYADVKNIAEKWTKIGQLIEETIEKGGDKIMDAKNNEKLLAIARDAVIQEFGQELVKDWTAEDFCNAEKIQNLRTPVVAVKVCSDCNVELKKDEEDLCADCQKKKEQNAQIVEEKKEVIATEPVAEVKAQDQPQEVKVDPITVVVTEVVQKVTDTFNTDTNQETVKVETETVRTVNDQVKEERKETVEVTYSYAQVEAIKAEYEAKLLAKDAEITFIKENAQKIIAIRAELGSYVEKLADTELFDESKMKIARLEKENSELKNKSIEVAKEEVTPEVKLNENLVTGHVEVKVEEKKESKETNLKTYLKKRYNK